MEIKRYLIISIFIMSIVLLTRWVPSLVWIIQTEQKDLGFLIPFILTILIILADVIIFRQFRILFNKIFLLVFLSIIPIALVSYFMDSLFVLFYIISIPGIIITSLILFGFFRKIR